MIRSDEDIANALAASLESMKDADKKSIPVDDCVFSPRELAAALRSKEEPHYSKHIRLVRETAKTAGEEDPLLLIDKS